MEIGPKPLAAPPINACTGLVMVSGGEGGFADPPNPTEGALKDIPEGWVRSGAAAPIADAKLGSI